MLKCPLLELRKEDKQMLNEVLLTMSQKEIQRLKIMERLRIGSMQQKEAAQILKISSRQTRRLLKKYEENGAAGLISKHRGKPSNNKFPEYFRQEVVKIAKEKYIDFGPTFLCEKLSENHGLDLSKETLRQWLISEEIWFCKRRRKARIHQSRERRSCFGELVQIDGSPHDWFEGRREKCCLLVFIDDATSKIVNLRFEESETTAGYFRATKEYTNKFGLPLAFYSDKDSVFRINYPETTKENQTQFERAMKSLGIEVICANSPQAKGRVERSNQTLQDRLVKEMRLEGINDIETANAYLPQFIKSYNKKFAVEPKSPVDAHRKLEKREAEVNLILGFQNIRTLSKNLELSYQNVVYQIQVLEQGYGLRHAKVTVCEALQGQVTLVYRGRNLPYKCYKKQKKTAEIIGAKTLNRTIDDLVRKSTKPKADHPWRKYRVIYA